MNKEQLLSWAVNNVRVWPKTLNQATPKVIPADLHWRQGEHSIVLCGDSFEVYCDEWNVAKIACGLSAASSMSNIAAPAPITAHSILEQAGGHMRDRAATYDRPEGERSMGATVDAFRAITGHTLTEEQGWLFMVCLKLVRGVSDKTLDSQEDLVAYAALMAECKARSLNEEKGAQFQRFDRSDVHSPDSPGVV